jgi:ABC-2 type transport system permease protein
VPLAKQNMIPWFFHIAATPSEHPIARNIDPVMLRYASEIQFVGNAKRRVSPILTTSTNSNITGMAPLVSLAMPLNYGENPALAPNPESEVNKHCVAGMVEGNFDSYFKNRIVESFAKNPESHYLDRSVREGKVFVVANGDFIRNYYDSMPVPGDSTRMQYRPISFNNLRYDEAMARAGMQPFIYGNQEFMQNLVDYMMGDNSVLDIRSKHIDIHPIDKEKVKTDAGFYKAINIGVPSLIIILLAFLLFYLRKRRYARS